MARHLLIFVSLIGIIHGFSILKKLESFVYDPDCTFSREDAITCIGKYVDTNHDGVISIKELSRVRRKFLGPFLRVMSYFISWKVDISSKKVLHDCDFNKDGKFTADDFRNATKTCLPTQQALCLLKVSCDRAEKKAHKGWF